MGTNPAGSGRRTDWRQVIDDHATRDREELSAEELDALGEAWFWSNEPWQSVEARRAAHQRWLDLGDTERALRSAWFVFYEHWLVGEAAVAQGWLARARRLVADPTSPAAGWFALAEADVAAADGDGPEALRHAEHATHIGRASGDRDLTAMGMQAEGRYLLALERVREGLERMDEAMVAVISNEIDPVFVGWIYCNLIATCHAVGDLRRANEWCEAAMRWCVDLRDGLLYPGLCRVYSAQLAQRRGDWVSAERDARQACADLLAYDQRYAGAAHYVLGEVQRLRGEHADADRNYRRSHELGHDPQPGMSLLRASEGHLDEALGALRPVLDTSLPDHDSSFLPRIERLLALVELAERAGELETMAAAVDAVSALAVASDAEIVGAYARVVEGRLAVATGDPAAAIGPLREAVEALVDLGLRYDAASARLQVAGAASALGDELTADIETRAARTVFDELGVPGPHVGLPDLPTHPLSPREVEVLGLVADGLTNREVAARLTLSEHTVARHLGNIFTKFGVRTRTAAVAEGTARGALIGRD